MSYLCHHAIIVTGSLDAGPFLLQAHAKAMRLFTSHVSPLVHSTVNGIASFFVAPDGSKEGWNMSDEGDRQRAEFVRYLRDEQVDEDGYPRFPWAEVQYGDQGGGQPVILHSSDEEVA